MENRQRGWCYQIRRGLAKPTRRVQVLPGPVRVQGGLTSRCPWGPLLSVPLGCRGKWRRCCLQCIGVRGPAVPETRSRWFFCNNGPDINTSPPGDSRNKKAIDFITSLKSGINHCLIKSVTHLFISQLAFHMIYMWFQWHTCPTFHIWGLRVQTGAPSRLILSPMLSKMFQGETKGKKWWCLCIISWN